MDKRATVIRTAPKQLPRSKADALSHLVATMQKQRRVTATSKPHPPTKPSDGNCLRLDPDVDEPSGTLHSSDPIPESNNRREGKRWCFVLNNPVQTDVFSEDHAIDPEIYDYLICANEKGEKGTPHLQGFICFKTKKRLSWITNNVFVSTITKKGRASWFLCDGSVQENIDYCKKGEQTKEEWKRLKTKGPNYGLNADFVEFGEPPSEGRGQGKKNKDDAYHEALALPSAEDALKFLSEHAPRDYCLQRHNLEKSLYTHFTPKEVYKPKFSLADFNHPGVLFPSTNSTLVWGPSNVGKTAFVKAHFLNPLFCTHMDDLKNFKKYDHDAIIFDDMSFHHMPIETVIHLVDTDNPSSIHCRHRTATIPAGVIKVFTHNTPNPFYDEQNPKMNDAQKEAINRRFKRMHVEYPLFTKK